MTASEILRVKDRAAWRRWLEKHHASSPSVWLAIRKKGSAKPGVTYEEAVEEALCFGWIDGTLNRFDDDHYRLRFGPRRRKSVWAANNKRRVEELIRTGRMTEAGLAAIEAAKRDGSWDSLEPETRSKRVAEAVRQAAENVRANH